MAVALPWRTTPSMMAVAASHSGLAVMCVLMVHAPRKWIYGLNVVKHLGRMADQARLPGWLAGLRRVVDEGA